MLDEDTRIDYFTTLSALHDKLDQSRAMLHAAQTLNAPAPTLALWERIVAQDRAAVINHRDRRTTQTTLPESITA